MKKLVIAILFALLFAACSSSPKRLLMKNCDKLGDNFYECEEVPAKEIGGRKR